MQILRNVNEWDDNEYTINHEREMRKWHQMKKMILPVMYVIKEIATKSDKGIEMTNAFCNTFKILERFILRL